MSQGPISQVGVNLIGLNNPKMNPVPDVKKGKLETIPHQIPQQGPTITEAAYFIQRVNRILQTQGGDQ